MGAPVAENRTRLKDANGAEIIIPEKSTLRIAATLLDETGAPVPLAALSTLTLTIYARDESTQPIINGVSAVNIKNTGRGVIGATDGSLVLTLQPDDNGLANSANDLEWHRLLIEGLYSTDRKLKVEIEAPVRNLAKV